MKTKTKQLAICTLLPLATGALSSFLTKDDMIAFRAAIKPALYPPEFVFPIVWTVLFLLMGIASYRIIRAHKKNDTAIYRVRIAIAYYVLQPAVNFLWPLVFFQYQAYWLAFAVLVVLIYIVLRTYYAFSAIDRFAGYYLLPYLVWLVFAGYLNVAVAILN